RVRERRALWVAVELPNRPPGVHPVADAEVDLHARNLVRAGQLQLERGREGQLSLEVVDRVVEVSHPVVVIEHRGFDVEILPERTAAETIRVRVQEGRQRL